MTARGLSRPLLAAALLLSVAVASELPRLPKDLLLPRGPDSPGQVVFRHDSHVDAARPDCLSCHPRRFPILGRSRGEVRAPLIHAAMVKGQACGACHGQAAFGFDECGNCHAE